MVSEYNELSEKAGALYEKIPGHLKDAYFQLVLFPVSACANLNDLYVSAAKNRLYAAQGRVSTNRMAEQVRKLFRLDSDLADRYHQDVADGKWNHMMSQTHIGYTYWQQPRQNNMPEVIEITVPDEFVGDIMGNLNSRRGKVAGVDARGSMQVVKAQVPMAEVLSYAADLTSMTGGQGSFSMEFSRYEEAPAQIREKIIAEAQKEKAD